MRRNLAALMAVLCPRVVAADAITDISEVSPLSGQLSIKPLCSATLDASSSPVRMVVCYREEAATFLPMCKLVDGDDDNNLAIVGSEITIRNRPVQSMDVAAVDSTTLIMCMDCPSGDCDTDDPANANICLLQKDTNGALAPPSGSSTSFVLPSTKLNIKGIKVVMLGLSAVVCQAQTSSSAQCWHLTVNSAGDALTGAPGFVDLSSSASHISMAKLSSTDAVVCFMDLADTASSPKGKCTLVSVSSGTLVKTSDTVTINSGKTDEITVAAYSATEAVACFSDGDSSNAATCRLMSASSSALTLQGSGGLSGISPGRAFDLDLTPLSALYTLLCFRDEDTIPSKAGMCTLIEKPGSDGISIGNFIVWQSAADGAGAFDITTTRVNNWNAMVCSNVPATVGLCRLLSVATRSPSPPPPSPPPTSPPPPSPPGFPPTCDTSSLDHSSTNECAEWCNKYTCYKDKCGGCSDCAVIASGQACYPWCNMYSCDLSGCLCSGCEVCQWANRVSRCLGWCTVYTCHDRTNCIGCDACADESTWCQGWCNQHTCANKYCQGCDTCVTESYVFIVSFQASGSVTDTMYTDGSACANIKTVIGTASGVDMSSATCSITAASVDIVVRATVASPNAGQAAKSNFNANIPDAATMQTKVVAAGTNIAVESSPSVDVEQGTPESTPAPSWAGRSRILHIFDKLKRAREANQAPEPEKITV